MQNNALVTVIITTYRRKADMLLEAVDSVLKQTYHPYELLVVSDNNPGDEYAISAAKACQARDGVRLIQLEKNSGAQVARNTGVRASKGEFVAFLDDDDIWMPEKLEKQMKLFDNPQVGLVYCDAINFRDNDRSRQWEDRAGNYQADFTQELRKDIIGSMSKAVIRKSCFDTCGMFDENLKARQDYDRWLAITKHYQARGVNEPLLWYRVHGGEQITKVPKYALDASRYVYQKYRADFDRDPQAKMNVYYERSVRCKGYKLYGQMLLNALHAFLISPKYFLQRRKQAHQSLG